MSDGRRAAIEAALRSFDYIDVGNHPGEDEDYEEIAARIEDAIESWEGPYRLEVTDRDGILRIEVTDAVSGQPLVMREWISTG